MKIRLLPVLFLLLLIRIPASLFSLGAQAPSDRPYLVIFSQCNNAEPYRAAQNASFRELWKTHPDVAFQIMDAGQDNGRQIAQIEAAVVKRPDLLIVAPNERTPITAVMGKAMDAGIPVICLERDIADADNYTCWIMSHNYTIGRQAGILMTELLRLKNGGPRGRIVDLRGLLDVEGEQKRYHGAWDYLSQYDGIVREAEAVCNWLQSDARLKMTEILRSHPEVDIVYGHNDSMAVGAYLAARDLGREDEILFVGVDGLPGERGGVKKVLDGVLTATFRYPLCTEKAVEIGNRILREPGFKPEKIYQVEPEMITLHNAAQIYGEE